MRIALRVTAVMLVLLAAAAAARLTRPSPEPYPCIRTSRSGWLTASSESALVRVEWGAAPRFSAGRPDEAVRWRALSDDSARAKARHLLEPMGNRRPTDVSEAVSLFVSCDGVGEYWHAEAPEPPGGLVDCLDPVHESYVSCLHRVVRGARDDPNAGALAAALAAEAGVDPRRTDDRYPDE